jgi:hypothetical protein
MCVLNLKERNFRYQEVATGKLYKDQVICYLIQLNISQGGEIFVFYISSKYEVEEKEKMNVIPK